jgi:Ni,Fe-hydrogenase III large subunit
MSTTVVRSEESGSIDALRDGVRIRRQRGERFAGLLGRGDPATGTELIALLAHDGGITPVRETLPAGVVRYPSLTSEIPAAFWYERAIHDLVGLIPAGHPRLDPLALPHDAEPSARPHPGVPGQPARIQPGTAALATTLSGPGVFTIPHGPVRSGVFESVEYLVETPGEDIPVLRIRPHAKHRGLQKRFEALPVAEGVLLAERVEGIASVAHALAYSHAVERLAGVTVPAAAALVRVLHAELERIANHLDVLAKLTDAAGLAVATARFTLHKERTLRLVGDLCGSRFGRGVITPGGVTGLPRLDPEHATTLLGALQRGIEADIRELLDTSSFLDRVRTAGPLEVDRARGHGALGPVGRGSGCGDDCRVSRPYDAYLHLAPPPVPVREAGDAQARMQVRIAEIETSCYLARQALGHLQDTAVERLRVPCMPSSGVAVGWAEAPQGEVICLLDVGTNGRIAYCAPRSASFHNLALFPSTFVGDILTDFPFNEASFGLSIAGVVM